MQFLLVLLFPFAVSGQPPRGAPEGQGLAQDREWEAAMGMGKSTPLAVLQIQATNNKVSKVF